MKNSTIKTIAVAISLMLMAWQGSSQCVYCDTNNVVTPENFSSALGMGNTSTGMASFVAGSNSIADADYSIAIGTSSEAKSWFAVALGSNALAYGSSSFAIGGHIKATASCGMVIGKGFDYTNKLINNIPYSLMVGFKSTKSTLFIGESPMIDKTGKVGIGDMTDPQAKLHIKNDFGEYASIRVEPWVWSNDNYAEIQFGDSSNTIRGTHNSGIGFYTPNNYIFHTGNVGIDKVPTEKLDVNGNIKASGFLLTANPGAGKLLQSDADGTAAWAEPAWNISGGNTFRQEGNVGIGTEAPLTSLHVAQGDIFLEDIASGIIMKSPDGKCWKGTLNNSGELVFSETICPGGSASAPEKQNDGSWNIYPNPAKGRIFIESNNTETEGFRYKITTASGVLCQSGKITSQRHAVSTKGLAPGYYSVTVISLHGSKAFSKVIALTGGE